MQQLELYNTEGRRGNTDTVINIDYHLPASSVVVTMDGELGGPLPAKFTALTLNWYCVKGCSEGTLICRSLTLSMAVIQLAPACTGNVP